MSGGVLKKDVLRNFAKFTGKHLCQIVFLIKLQLRRDFEEFFRRMRLKWYFRNESTPYFKESTVSAPKSTCKPPKGHPHLEVKLKNNFLN